MWVLSPLPFIVATMSLKKRASCYCVLRRIKILYLTFFFLINCILYKSQLRIYSFDFPYKITKVFKK